MRLPHLGWRNRTAYPAAWFALGAFASWTGCMWFDIASTTTPSRWRCPEGIAIGGFLAVMMAILMAAIFAGWLAWRRRERYPSYPLMLVALGLGLIHPFLCVLPLIAFERLLGLLPVIDLMVPLVILCSPLFLGEIALRFSE